MFFKAFVLLDTFGALLAAAVDDTAQKLLLYAAVATAVTVLWRQVVKPLGQLLKHGLVIIKKTVAGLEVLEHMPARWAEQEKRDKDKDERIAAVEAEVGIVVASTAHLENDVKAIRRKLGVGDDEVRAV